MRIFAPLGKKRFCARSIICRLDCAPPIDTSVSALLAIVRVVLDRSAPESFAAFEAAVRQLTVVPDRHLVADDFDYFLKIRVQEIAGFNRMHSETPIALPGVRQTRSFLS